MSSSEEAKSQNIGVNVNGSVVTQGDLVGRDKIIQNIILVGQFLDFAKVEGLIPKPSTPSDFESVSAAFEASFNQRLDGDLARATAFAGEVLGEVLRKKHISGHFSALPFRSILSEITTIVFTKLKKLSYWDSFCDSSNIIWLHSLSLLWKKHFKADRLYGFGYGTWYVKDKKDEKHLVLSIYEITNEQFRIIMVGLVIDLIRIYSTASDDVKFWQGLVDLLGPEKKSG
jgi:hypothetical protein